MHARFVFGNSLDHYRFLDAGTNSSSSSACKAQRLPLEVPTFPCACFINGFLELLIFRIKKTDACQLSRIVELRFLDRPLPFFLSSSCFCSGPNFWKQMIAPCGCLNLCKPSPGPHISVRRLSIQSCDLRQTGP